jgi:DNA-binding NarL/FixJ family response regulator
MGFSNKEIAEQLFISVHTVMTHRKNIIEKTGIKSISGLTMYAIMTKLINPETIDMSKLI